MADDGNGRATIREVYDLLQKLDRKWDDRFAELDDKYAAKWVEKLVYAVALAIILGAWALR